MNLNPQQLAVMDWRDNSTGSLNLIARAGSGKTSTLVELSNRISGRAYFGAFNKAIATELQSRITARNVTAGTMHSLGLSLWRQIVRRSEIDSNKVRNLARVAWPMDKVVRGVVASAVSYAKQAGFGLTGSDYTDHKTWGPLFDHYDLWDEVPDVVSPERILDSCIAVYDDSLEMCTDAKSVIDFDDMILAPLYYWDRTAHGSPASYDWVMIDEAQDTNEVRRKLAEFVLKPGGRLVAVGDDRQAIYGFAGANHDSMELIKKDMGSAELPLSVTYRCPKSVVSLAQSWVPDITAHESAPEGVVTSIYHTELWMEQFNPESDVILCRFTRPLLGIATRLRDMGIRCRVEGNSGKAIIALANKWGDITIVELKNLLNVYLHQEVAKWQAKNREDKVEWAVEKVSTVLDFCRKMKGTDRTPRLVQKIEMAFGEDENGGNVLTLCTIHRSKGREWDRVFLIGRNAYMPSPWAKAEWELLQEDNLCYVAVTRAKRELVEVRVSRKKKREDPDWWDAENWCGSEVEDDRAVVVTEDGMVVS